MTDERPSVARVWAGLSGAGDAGEFGGDGGSPRGFDPTAEAARVARFRRFLDDLGGANGHFRESQRHMLLGLGEVARVASQHLAEIEHVSRAARVAGGVTALVHSVLELAAARIPPLQPEGDLRVEARLEALANLRALLRAEAERYEGSDEHLLKRETIRAIVEAITQEMERIAQQAPASAGSPPKRQTGQAEKIHIRTTPENLS